MMDLYKQSGVDLEAGYESVERIKKHTQRTFRTGVMGGIGSFGGNFDLSSLGIKEPILVSGTDGVGTKLKLAFEMNQHDTIGVDCVAMCVNDVVVQGAAPLYFLDYLAVGKNYPAQIEQILKGIADGCVQSNCALIGGETAEMPSMYNDGEYDVAGFCVGVVEKTKLITGENISRGDVIIGLNSSGVHSNGFSLVRKIISDNHLDLSKIYDPYFTESLGNILLTPTTIYVKAILELIETILVKGMCHITGGGFYENVPRMFTHNKELGATFNGSSWQKPSIYHFLQETGNITEKEIFNVFNMGIGFMVVLAKDNADKALEILNKFHTTQIIGEVTNTGLIEIV
jgi:phosphoribosylformylglycinamidine cyclo-ligase